MNIWESMILLIYDNVCYKCYTLLNIKDLEGWEKYPHVHFPHTLYLQHFLSGASDYPRQMYYLATNQEITLLIFFPCRTVGSFFSASLFSRSSRKFSNTHHGHEK